jgi:kinesin family protein 1
MSYFSAGRIHHSLTAVYSIDLVPPIAQSTQELWRLDTGNKHVAGEAVLGDWKPRGVSLLEDWQRANKTAKGIAEKQVTGVVLDLLGELGSEDHVAEGSEMILKKSLGLWEKHMKERYIVSDISTCNRKWANDQIDLERQSADEEAISKKLRKLMPELETKLVPHVKLAPSV